jgi:hypothetical protein
LMLVKISTRDSPPSMTAMTTWRKNRKAKF